MGKDLTEALRVSGTVCHDEFPVWLLGELDHDLTFTGFGVAEEPPHGTTAPIATFPIEVLMDGIFRHLHLLSQLSKGQSCPKAHLLDELGERPVL